MGADERPISIAQGAFGRATVNFDNRSMTPHAHGEPHLIFNLGGDAAAFRLRDEQVGFDASQVLVIPPWTVHAPVADRPNVLLVLFLAPAWLGSSTLLRASAGAVPADVTTLAAAQRLAQGIVNATVADIATVEAATRDVVALAARDEAEHHGSNDGVVASPRLTDARVHRAVAFLQAQPVATLTVDAAAAHVGLSRSRFFEQFKRFVGVTPQQYIDWLRVRHATTALTTTSAPLATIAEELGFSNQAHFSRFFSGHLNLTPSAFRRRAVGIPAAISEGR